MENKRSIRVAFWYATKVSVIAMGLPPLMVVCFFLPFGNMDTMLIPLFMLVISGVCSIPSWLLFWGCVRLVNDQAWEVTVKKSVLCVIGVTLTGLAFAVMNFDSGGNPLTVFSAWGDVPSIQLGYAATICLGIVYFDLNDPAPVPSDELPDAPDTSAPIPHLHDTND